MTGRVQSPVTFTKEYDDWNGDGEWGCIGLSCDKCGTFLLSEAHCLRHADWHAEMTTPARTPSAANDQPGPSERMEP